MSAMGLEGHYYYYIRYDMRRAVPRPKVGSAHTRVVRRAVERGTTPRGKDTQSLSCVPAVLLRPERRTLCGMQHGVRHGKLEVMSVHLVHTKHTIGHSLYHSPSSDLACPLLGARCSVPI